MTTTEAFIELEQLWGRKHMELLEATRDLGLARQSTLSARYETAKRKAEDLEMEVSALACALDCLRRAPGVSHG